MRGPVSRAQGSARSPNPVTILDTPAAQRSIVTLVAALVSALVEIGGTMFIVWYAAQWRAEAHEQNAPRQ